MSITPGSTKKKNTKTKDIETFPAPALEIELHPNILLNASLENDYQTICGALDYKDHPLSAYLINENLFNKPNEYGKKPFDLACSIGNHEFLRTLLERAERLNGVNNTPTAPTGTGTGTVDLIDLRRTNSNGLTCLHHACIWGHLDLCKLIVNQNSALGSILIKMKTNNNETPKDIALRYNQIHVVNFLEFAEIRQLIMESINNLKDATSDVEKTVGKLTKDDRKRIDKVYTEIIEWLEKSKDDYNLELIKQKKAEIDSLTVFYTGKMNSSNSKPGSAVSRT